MIRDFETQLPIIFICAKYIFNKVYVALETTSNFANKKKEAPLSFSMVGCYGQGRYVNKVHYFIITVPLCLRFHPARLRNESEDRTVKVYVLDWSSAEE